VPRRKVAKLIEVTQPLENVSGTLIVPMAPCRDLTPGRLTDKLGFTWVVYSEFSAL
jgi:hypothetical protein